MSGRPSRDAGATAVVFPGQGSQQEGMREEVRRDAPEILDELEKVMDEDPFERLADSTRFVQPAVFCRSLASWRVLRDAVRPAFLAGHSFGDISALVAADALDLRDGIRLVVARGEITAACAGDGGMLAVLKLDNEQVEEIARRHDLAVANYNAPGQVVLSGPADRLDAAADEVWAARGSPVRLAVQGAFHSRNQRAAVPRFRELLATVRFRRPRLAVIASATARPFRDPATELADSLVQPVRWTDVLHRLAGTGVTDIVEAAPGEVLCGLVRRTLEGVTARPADHVLSGLART